jgi:hypothetical protein
MKGWSLNETRFEIRAPQSSNLPKAAPNTRRPSILVHAGVTDIGRWNAPLPRLFRTFEPVVAVPALKAKYLPAPSIAVLMLWIVFWTLTISSGILFALIQIFHPLMTFLR